MLLQALVSLKVTGILHLGAHLCEERNLYHTTGLTDSEIIWIEGNPDLVRQVELELPTVQIYQALLSDVDNATQFFHVASDTQSSSLLKFGTHLRSYPDITTVNSIPLQTLTVDTFFKLHPELPIQGINLVTIHVQGAELQVLRGMTKLLPQCDILYMKVNTEEVYEDCTQLSDLDEFLMGWQFERTAIAMTEEGWGEALYQRRAASAQLVPQ
jgi:FkbM family methyltransferase